VNKRFLCALLAVALLLSVVIGPVPVRAVEEMTISDAGLAMIKRFEGFSPWAHWDNKQYSVGYGTRCSAEDAAKYNAQPNGITEEQAEKLLREQIAEKIANVNKFAATHNITFTQGEFDALVSLTYNIGQTWTYSTDWAMYKAVTSGDRGAYLAYAICLYSSSGGVTSQGHLQRRLLELQMFLYNIYDTDKNWPEDLRYVLLDANGGTNRYNPYGFNIHYPTKVEWLEMTAPTGTDEEGKTFTYELAGWYTKPVGGEKIEQLDESLRTGTVLYAQWKNPITGQIEDIRPGEEEDVWVKATERVVLREGPGTYYNEYRALVKGELLHITRVITGKDGKLWGQTEEGWVLLTKTNYGVIPEAPDTLEPGTWATITTSSGVRVRSAPHLDDTDTGARLLQGTVVQIVETQMEDDVRKWGKMPDGNWICLEENGKPYATIEVITEEDITPPEPSVPDVSDAITVDSIHVYRMPTKLRYGLNGSERTVDVTGSGIRIEYSDGSRVWDELTTAMTSGFDNTKLGTNTITVTFGGKTTTFDVQIVPVNISEITMHTLPQKLQYFKGNQTLDLTGAAITVHYSPNGTEVLPVTADMVTGFDPTVAGTQHLTVTYKDYTTTFAVEVIDNDLKEISVHTLPEKTRYLMGEEELNLAGATLCAVYGYDGATYLPITADMVTGFDNQRAGTQTLTVTYKGFTTTFTVEVVSNHLESISMHSLPQKQEYLMGVESLDLTGAAITLHFGYTEPQVIPVTAKMVTGFDNETPGTKTVTVTYEGFTTTFTVEVVKNHVVGISMHSLPNKLEYLMAKHELDLTGAVISVDYSHSETVQIPVTADMVTGFDNQTSGTKVLTVTYEGVSTTFAVEVVESQVVGISMYALPSKLEYLLDKHELDLTGAMISVDYSHSETVQIPVTADMVTGFDNRIPGAKTLTVTYEGFTTSFSVEVVENRVVEITMQTLPDKLQYLQGTEDLDLAGATVAVRYSYTGTVILPVTADMVTGFDNLTGGKKQLKVTYAGKETTFAVEITLHEVVFLNYDGSVLSVGYYALGDTVVAPEAPTKPEDIQGEYGFVGWDREIVACAGSTSYTAVFELQFPRGDADHDGVVTEDDGIYLLWHVFFPEDYPMHTAPDYNGDGIISEDDGIYLLWHVFFPEDYPLH